MAWQFAFVTVCKMALDVSSARGFQGHGGAGGSNLVEEALAIPFLQHWTNVIAANKIFFLTSSLG